MPFSSVICLLILVQVCKLTHTLPDTHTPTKCRKLFHACHCQFLSPRSNVARSVSPGFSPYQYDPPPQNLISVCFCKEGVMRRQCASWPISHKYTCPTFPLTLVYVDFFFPSGSKRILIQVLCSHTVSKVHLCNSLNESRREPASQSGVHY